MSVKDCLKRYPAMAENIFSGKKKTIVRRILESTSSKYDSRQLEEEIKQIVDSKALPNVSPHQPDFQFDEFHLPSDLCKT